MKVFDITTTLRPEMPTWPGEPGPKREMIHSIASGAGANVSAFSMGSHTGTHIDAPYHFVEGGITVERLSIETLVGPAVLLDIHGDEHVSAEQLEAAHLPTGTTRLLIRTRNTERQLLNRDTFDPTFIGIAKSGAEWLVNNGVKLVGVDYLSVEPSHNPGSPAHHTLLGAGLVAIEGCDFTSVAAGEYILICAPLKMLGADGAPARVYLIQL